MRILFHSLCLAALFGLAHGLEKKEGKWTTLDNCRFIESYAGDGDSFPVMAGDERITFRLYYVDALETSPRYKYRVGQQADYFNLPVDRVPEGGQAASEITRDFLDGPFEVITCWEDARGSIGNKRYFAFIRRGDQYLSEELVAAGLARIYGKPAESRWPGGMAPRKFYAGLKELEAEAKAAERGLWGWEALSPKTRPTTNIRASRDDPKAASSYRQPMGQDIINVNTANSEELQSLSGIGPVLAGRIIQARPIATIESLVEISGISTRILARIQDRIITEDPPPPPETMAYYTAELDRYLGTEINVRVSKVEAIDLDSPPGFRAATLWTAYQGVNGGQTTAFVPEDFFESFLEFYRTPDRTFTALLHRHQGALVLVFRRD